jgi:ceramide glucosyltransferase
VILHDILAALALLSLGLTLWQWLAARRFPLHRRVTDKSFAPAVTLLKPLKGADEHTEACLRRWFAQDYAGEIQILFGVASTDDPACVVARKLLGEFPQRDAELVVCGERLGANAKVSKLAQLQRRAKHDVLVISDADVFVPPDLLANVVHPLTTALSLYDGERVAARTGEGRVGLVNCFYRLTAPSTIAMRWETVAVNADFWSQVLQSRSLKPLDFALGAVMAVRRAALEQSGGFTALADYLADDFQLGNRVARAGWRVELCPVVVECRDPAKSWREVWAHQLRWARTIRVCQPLPYFFSILSNATLWPLVWLWIAHPTIVLATHATGSVTTTWSLTVPMSLFAVGVCLLLRILTALDLQRRLTQSRAHFRDWWLVPVKDLLHAAIWLLAFTSNRVEWRGERLRVQRDGRLAKD